MPFDPILSVGHEPKAQPAIISKSEVVSFGPDSGTVNVSSTLDIPEDVQVQYVEMTLTVLGEGSHGPMTITLFRNDATIQVQNWNINFAEISALQGSGIIFANIGPKFDYLRKNDTMRMQLIASSGGVPESYTFTFNFAIYGTWA